MKGSFDSIISDSRPVVVDFYADWCQPCRMQAPILKEVADELGDRIRVIKIDVDSNNELAMRYDIRGVPTLMVFQNGEVRYRQAGVHTRPQLMNILINNLK